MAPIEVGRIMPETKNVWREDNAADVIGPVERGERIRDKKADRRFGSGIV